jgi:hypothetical protein
MFYGHTVLRSYCLILLFFIVFVGCSSVSPVVKRTPAARTSEFKVWTADFRSDEMKNSYRFVLNTPKSRITGLLILKKKDDEWLGTLMNEMGAKAFDFIVTDRKCELFRVISMMDKWYIKKTVSEDLYFFIQADNPKASFYKRLERFEQDHNRVINNKKKQIVVRRDGAVRLVNKRRNLQYELRKMVELDPDKMIL